MARQQITKNIGGVDYSLGEISPSIRSRMFLKLTLLLGPQVMGAGMKYTKGKKFDFKEFMDSDPGDLFTKVADKMNEDDLFEMIKKLLTETYPVSSPLCKLGVKDNFDIHFDYTNMSHLPQLMIEIFKFQFGVFFSGKGTQKLPEPERVISEQPMIP